MIDIKSFPLNKREFEDKYAYVATMDEIKENDYNLNIPRYVDTFEEEEPVDLKAVSEELRKVDSEMVEIDMAQWITSREQSSF